MRRARRPAFILGVLAASALAAGAAYVALAEFPAPTRNTVHTIPDVPLKQ